MRLPILMLTFALLTPLTGCKVAYYLDQYETENIAILFKEARENRRLNEQTNQERKDDIDENLSPEEERKRQAEQEIQLKAKQERIEKNVQELESEVNQINKEIRSLTDKRFEMQESNNQEKLKPEIDRISKKIRSLKEKRLEIQENIKTRISNSPKAAAERERRK